MIHFRSPWMFLLLLLIPLLLILRKRIVAPGSIRFSSTGNAAKAGMSLKRQLAFVPTLFRVLALVCLITAIAGPQSGKEEMKDISKGIAIEMVVDRSGSMGAEMEYRGQRLNRLEVVKKVFKEFSMGNGKDLSGRPNDLIGMIAFARYADTICPLTLAHGALVPFIDSVKLVKRRQEDGTAIGDGLALAAARLKTVQQTLKKQQKKADNSYKIKSKVIILLSDGENNAGKYNPVQAAELAKKWGIKVYTIAIGGGDAVTSIRTPFGVYKVPMGTGVDTTTLKNIAEKTGGIFQKARDAKSLHAIYKKIDQMEKSEIESIRFINYKEEFMWFAIAALILIGCEIILTCTVFRKIP